MLRFLSKFSIRASACVLLANVAFTSVSSFLMFLMSPRLAFAQLVLEHPSTTLIPLIVKQAKITRKQNDNKYLALSLLSDADCFLTIVLEMATLQ